MTAKKLDQYTPEERAQMIGMWAERHRGDEPMVLVVIEEINPDREYAGCTVPGVRYVEIPRHRLTSLTPRFDLLRAWTPEGEPVPSQAEWSTVDRSTSPANQWKGLRFSAGNEEYARTSAHSFGYDVERRFITDWEAQA